jgi:hypothetical protein
MAKPTDRSLISVAPGQCLIIDPDDRPSAEELLHHEFLQKFSEDETLHEVGTAIGSLSFLLLRWCLLVIPCSGSASSRKCN